VKARASVRSYKTKTELHSFYDEQKCRVSAKATCGDFDA